MDNGGQESHSRQEDGPGTLDVVDWDEDGAEYQIAAQVIQKGKPTTYVVIDTSTGRHAGRIVDSSFRRYFPTLDPQGAHVQKLDEGVRKVGQFIGGRRE